MTAELKRTPLFEHHKSAGARIVPFAGWEMPVQYAGVVGEHHAVRERAGLFDVSHMGELHLRGPGAEKFVNSLVSNDVSKLAVGKAIYTVALNEGGTILDDLIVYRIAAGDVLVVCNAGNLSKMSAHFAKHAAKHGSASGEPCEFADESAGTSLLALQGPKAIEVMRAAGASTSLLELPRFGVGRGEVAGSPVLVARTGYTGEDGYELFVPNSGAGKLWDALLASGKEFGIEPIGLGARDTLRLEAALRLYGNDIDETTDPLEAGLGWVVKTQDHDFLGRAALLERQAHGLTRKLVGLEMLGRGIARHDYPVVDTTLRPIGRVTSGSPGPTVGKNIALAYVAIEHAAIDSSVFVEIRGKNIEARVVALPFYKR